MSKVREYIFGKTWHGIVGRLTCLAVFFIFFLSPNFELMRIDGESMEPTFEDHEIIFIFKSAYRYQNPTENDVIAIQHHGDKDVMIKRIIGTPGDIITVSSGIISVNGQEVADIGLDFYDDNSLVLQEYQYYYIGDNHTVTVFGSCAFHEIVGKVMFQE